MTIKEIQEILEVFQASGLAEMEVQRGKNSVRLKRDAGGTVQTYAAAPVVAAAPAASVATPTPAAAASAADTVPVLSPIVGTFYESSSPDAPPFVKVGDIVSAGQVLCIIESMKLMNEIEAEVGGVIVAKLVENGKPVEYGQPLFQVKPA